MRGIKSKALVEFLKHQDSVLFKDARYDGTVVKAIRIGRIDVQILLSKRNNESGAVKVGIYVKNPPNPNDIPLLHKQLDGIWKPEGTRREESKNWEQETTGVQIWFRMNDLNWKTSFNKNEKERVANAVYAVYEKIKG